MIVTLIMSLCLVSIDGGSVCHEYTPMVWDTETLDELTTAYAECSDNVLFLKINNDIDAVCEIVTS